MATYFQGSNDNSQTLRLLNPAGYAAATYTDAGAAAAAAAAAAANSGNMILLNPQSIPSQTVAAQHFLGIPFPASAQIAGMASPNPNQAPPNSVSQDMNSSLLASRISSQAFNHLWRNRASGSGSSSNGELSFMNDHITDISHLGLRRSAMGSLQEQQQQQQQSAAMLSSALSLQQQQQSEHSHSHGHGQGLSLSLSSQQPPLGTLAADSDMNCSAISATSEENLTRADRSANKWSSFRAPNSSRDGPGLLESATFQVVGKNQIQQQHHLDSAPPVPAAATGGGTIVGFSNAVLGSRYLKAAQQLLDEVVNVGKGLKPDTSRQQQQQLKVSMGGSRENSVTEGGGGGAAGGDRPPADLTSAERQELQMKKAKLVAMLDEVDQRYRQYYHQMQIVVQSFENAAGYGSARTYTAVALQTISRHFRCLRDAISGQIKAISKNLGDEDSTSKGETSRLRFVDQQLRQQRALQQLGMIQQHAWRPQRGLPERSVSVLRSWLFEHFLHPYPKDADKHMLAKKTGLTRNQVSNWFINARVRLWKPMVEEMYLEEQKEADTERGSSGEKSGKENSDKKDDSESKEGSGSGNGGAVGYEQVSGKPTSNIHENISNNSEDSRKTGSASRSENVMRNPHHQTFDMDDTTTMHNQIYTEVDNDGLRHAQQQQQQQQLKKARTVQESASLLSPNMSLDVDFKSDETNSAEFGDTPHNKFSEERHNTEADFSLVHNAMVHADNGGSFGSYHHQLGDLGRLSQGSFAPTRFSGSGGVSLTLGLQHTDGGLSLQGSQHSFLSPQSLGLGRRHDLGANSSDYCSIESSAAHSAASIYDNLGFQNQKRFATQLMH